MTRLDRIKSVIEGADSDFVMVRVDDLALLSLAAEHLSGSVMAQEPTAKAELLQAAKRACLHLNRPGAQP